MKTTSSSGFATSAENTNFGDERRHSVANDTWPVTKQAFVKTAKRKEEASFPASNVFQGKYAPFRVSVSGEWALKNCQVGHMSYFLVPYAFYAKRSIVFVALKLSHLVET